MFVVVFFLNHWNFRVIEKGKYTRPDNLYCFSVHTYSPVLIPSLWFFRKRYEVERPSWYFFYPCHFSSGNSTFNLEFILLVWNLAGTSKCLPVCLAYSNLCPFAGIYGCLFILKMPAKSETSRLKEDISD